MLLTNNLLDRRSYAQKTAKAGIRGARGAKSLLGDYYASKPILDTGPPSTGRGGYPQSPDSIIQDITQDLPYQIGQGLNNAVRSPVDTAVGYYEGLKPYGAALKDGVLGAINSYREGYDNSRSVVPEVRLNAFGDARNKANDYLTSATVAGGVLASELFPFSKTAKVASKATGLLNDVDKLGFYSPTERLAANLQPKGTGQQYLGILAKGDGQGSRIQEEMQDMGLDTWLQSKGKVSRDEVLDYIGDNRLRYGKETLTSGNPYPYTTASEWQDAVGRAERRGDFDEGERLTAAWESSEGLGAVGDSKYQGYSQKGGTNYQENLLTVPDDGVRFKELQRKRDANGYESLTEAEKTEFAGYKFGSDGYKSPHYDPKNIGLTTRTQSMNTPQGDSVHLMDELQSDWHSDGRTKGYRIDTEQEKVRLKAEQEKIIKEANKYTSNGQNAPTRITDAYTSNTNRLAQLEVQEIRGVPNAPSKNSWMNQGIKSELTNTINDGKDYFAWTGGDIQADRYSLSNQVSEVVYSKDGTLYAFDIDGQKVINKKATPEELPDLIGKEAADRLMGNEAFTVTRATSPNDLIVKEVNGYFHVEDANGTFISNVTEHALIRENKLREMMMNDPWISGGDDVLPMLTPDDYTEDFARQQAWGKIESGEAYNDNKIHQHPRAKDGARTLSGEDLKVGGEGMKGFYDKDVKKRTEKIIKKLDPNAKVEIIELDNGNKVWGVKITDKMRGTVKDRGGMPLYSIAPIAGAGLLAASMNNEQQPQPTGILEY